MLMSHCNVCGKKIVEAENTTKLEIELENYYVDYFESFYQTHNQENPYYDENAKYVPVIYFNDNTCNECCTKIREFIKNNLSQFTCLEILGPKLINTNTIAIAEFTDNDDSIESKETINNESSPENVES